MVTERSGGLITVVDRDGFTRTVRTDDATRFTQDGEDADSTAIVEGANIAARGSVGSDGTSLDAKTVEVRTHRPEPPAGPRGGPGPHGGPGS